MNASELIQALQRMVDREGDKPVLVSDGYAMEEKPAKVYALEGCIVIETEFFLKRELGRPVPRELAEEP